MRVILKQSCLKENYQVHFALIVGRFCEFSACGGYQYCLILKQQLDKAEYDMKSYADLRGYNSHHGESKRSKPKRTKHAHHFVKLPSSYHLPIPWQI